MGRFAAIAAALAGLATLGGHPGTRTYRDGTYGFVVSYPASFHLESFNYHERASVTGVAIGNAPHPGRLVRTMPATVPRRTVVVEIDHTAGGPPRIGPPSGQDTSLPLSRASFHTLPGWSVVTTSFVGNGWDLIVGVWIGRGATKAAVASAWRIVRSVHMRPLRSGQTTGEGPYVVLQPASTYPVVSVTPVGATLLVHAPNGFYAVVQQGPSCGITFTTDPVAFACPDGRAWDRVGRPLWPGASPYSDALAFASTDVAGDGHVLLAPDSRVVGPTIAGEVERQVWG